MRTMQKVVKVIDLSDWRIITKAFELYVNGISGKFTFWRSIKFVLHFTDYRVAP